MRRKRRAQLEIDSIYFEIAARETSTFRVHHCSSRTIFDVKLAEDMFDVLTDGPSGRTQNDADVLVAFAL